MMLPLYAPLPTPDEMYQWDQMASNDLAMPPALLMENASREALHVLTSLVPLTKDTRILVFMGRGNNGGDGAALARSLHNLGYRVLVCDFTKGTPLKDPAKKHVLMAKKAGVEFCPFMQDEDIVLPAEWCHPDIVIDALAGTGLNGPVRQWEQGIIAAINAQRNSAFIFSLDVPSGLCVMRGLPQPVAVQAHATVTFEAGKPGLFMPEAHIYTGAVHVRGIGLPLAVKTARPASWQLLQPEPGAWASPPPDLHKGRAGKVLVIGGSFGMTGAPVLACLGALRCGAGLVTLLTVNGEYASPSGLYPEIMVKPLVKGKQWTAATIPAVLANIRKFSPSAIVIGPGMGRTSGTGAVVRAVLQIQGRCPVVVDADALHYARSTRSHTYPLTPRDVLTPHPGEMAAMLTSAFFQENPDNAEHVALVQRNRPKALATFLEACPAVTVLKGAGSLVGQQGLPVTLSPHDIPALAVGGAGDVLAGIIGALLARGYTAYDAACLGVHVHARAGGILSAKAPQGHLARDIAEALPVAWAELCPKKAPASAGEQA